MSDIKKGRCDNLMFKTNPNLTFQEVINENAHCLGLSCNIEIFYSHRDNQMCLISGERETNNINIISFLDNKKIISLKGHKEMILNLRYFDFDAQKEEYLISSDRIGNVLVWDLKEFKLINSIDTKYEQFITSCLLFRKNNSIYAAVSNIAGNVGSKVFDIVSGNLKKEIKSNNDIIIFYLIYWKNDDKDYLIQCGKGRIIINGLLDGGTYAEFPENNDYLYYLNGLIYKKEKDKDDYLMVSATYGTISIWNLQKKLLVSDLKFENCQLYNIIRWSEKYFIILNSYPQQVSVLDINKYEIISEVFCQEFTDEKYIKKVLHPKYGECLVSIGLDYKVKLYRNKNFLIN